MTIKYYSNSPYATELKHTLYIVSLCYDVSFISVENKETADITIGEESDDTLFFTSVIFETIYSAHPYFALDKMELTKDGREDNLSLIFYLVNCLQELNPDPVCRDNLGRYNAPASVQMRNNALNRNVVSELAAKVIAQIPSGKTIKAKTPKTRIFLSHDMDTVYGSLLQDSFWHFKKMNVAGMAQIMFANLLKGPQWLNVDRIMSIESESDFRSTFFWMTQHGPTERGLKNSDYKITDLKVKKAISDIATKGWHNGLHKGISAATFGEELKSLPPNVVSNRYHYLYFDTFRDLHKVEEAGVKLDCSIGFASEMGFRNSFGLPVHLFDIKNKQPFQFLENPLHCMDGTYSRYHFKPGDEFATDVIKFVESNNTNCVLSVLFHNNYVSEYKFGDYCKAFKKLLAYFYESGFQSISEDEILKLYA